MNSIQTIGKRKKTAVCITSFAVPFFMLLAFCAVKHIAPFGDNTFLYLDMKRQYVDFYSYYKSVFTGNNDFLYSFSSALGQAMPGFTAYYLTSPLLIPFIFIGRMQLPDAVTFLCITKIALSGLTACLYLNRHSHRTVSFSAIIFSTSFAMSAYMTANMCNVMWLDPIIMLPLILLGVDKIIDGGSPWLYIGSMAFALFTNYYITYMIIIFTLIYLLCGLFIDASGMGWQRRSTVFIKYVSSSAAACALPAYILLPTFMELKASTKNSIATGLNITLKDLNPLAVLTKSLSLTFNEDQIMNGMPHLCCGILMLIFTVMFYLDRAIPAYRRIRCAVMTGSLMLSFSFAEIDIIWHAGTEPMGYQYRYAFLFVFVMIVCAYDFFVGLREKKRQVLLKELAAALAVVIVLSVYAVYTKQTFFNEKKFAFNLLLATAAEFMVFFMVQGKRSRVRKTAYLLLILLQAGDLMLNARLIYAAESEQQMKASEFRNFIAGINTAVRELPGDDERMYRMENCTPRSENDSMQFGYNGITHYDSMNSETTMSMLRYFGYESNTVFSNYEAGNTHLANDLLGIKYIISSRKQSNSGMRFDPSMVGGEPTDKQYIYTERCALPLALIFDRKHYISVSDPFSMQTGLIDTLCGHKMGILRAGNVTVAAGNGLTAEQKGAVTKYVRELTEPVTNGKNDPAYTLRYTVTPVVSGSVFFYLTMPGKTVQNIEPVYMGRSYGSYGNDYNWSVVDLGAHRAGEKFEFDLVLHDKVTVIGKAMFVSEDEHALEGAYSTLRPSFAVVKKISSSHLRITVPDGDNWLYLSVPYDNAWHAQTSDGKELSISNFVGLMAVNTEGYQRNSNVKMPASVSKMADGSKSHGSVHEIDLRYEPEGMLYGSIISIIDAVLLMIYAAAAGMRKRRDMH